MKQLPLDFWPRKMYGNANEITPASNFSSGAIGNTEEFLKILSLLLIIISKECSSQRVIMDHVPRMI